MSRLLVAFTIVVLFGGACKKKNTKPDSAVTTWSGIGDPRACDWNNNRGFCISEGKTYDCVKEATYSNDGCATLVSQTVTCLERKPDDLKTDKN